MNCSAEDAWEREANGECLMRCQTRDESHLCECLMKSSGVCISGVCDGSVHCMSAEGEWSRGVGVSESAGMPELLLRLFRSSVNPIPAAGSTLLCAEEEWGGTIFCSASTARKSLCTSRWVK